MIASNRIALAGLALAGALTLPAVASATEVHTATAEAACVAGVPTAAFSYITDVPADPLPIDPKDLDHFMAETFTLDGQVVWTNARVVPGSAEVVIPIGAALTGRHTVRAFTSWGGEDAGSADSGEVSVQCGPYVPPPVVDQPVIVSTTPPPPVVRIVPSLPEQTYVPGPDYPPRIKRVPRRVPVTCAYLRRVGAGPRTYTRLGYYPGCRTPKTIAHPRRVTRVAVLG